jgi:hypothetical protein
MIGVWTITLTITIGFAKITKLNQKFLSPYIKIIEIEIKMGVTIIVQGKSVKFLVE